MPVVIEFSPVIADATNTSVHHVNGIWNAAEATERRAVQHSHHYRRPPLGPVDFADAQAAINDADALILAPTVAAPSGMWQPSDGREAGKILGHRILDSLAEQRPDLHVILISHFLVGHGVAHHNAKPHTRSLRALEEHLRAGRNPWTILRPTWFSTIHDPAYQTRLSGDRHADGLVSAQSVADTVIAAVENPDVSQGRTASIFNLSVPGDGQTDLRSEFSSLAIDFEAERQRAGALR